MAKILTVTSGKGGVGKTNISVNLAVFLAQQGYRTCLFDADLGLANINILLGVYPEYNLEDVIEGKKDLKDIVIHDKNGIDIIPGSSGVAKMESLSSAELDKLAGAFKSLEDYDYFIFDTSAGISKNVIAFCINASEVVLVITPEPTSLTDAYALMKILSLNGFEKTVKVVVNQCKNPKTAQLAFTKLRDTVRKFIGIHLQPLGTIVSDGQVPEAVVAQKPFIIRYPDTPAAKGLKTVGANLLEKSDVSNKGFTLENFWHRCVDIFTESLKLPSKKSEAPRQKETPQRLGTADPQAAAKPATEAETNEAAGVNAQASIQDPETTHRLLQQLVENISNVSKELAGIKTLLERGLLSGFGTGASGAGFGLSFPAIPLDFEAFLAEQETGGEDNDN